ncbi:MAG: SDR family oxidoreductase [Desulfobacterales bacterium]|jgi:uncharacterized protein YbjT (DUF2867 family)|nr:SDR family oxidoreductase [Desulfobacterales bacterium]
MKPILVAGATGYVANRLIPALLEKGCRVRAMARTVEKLADRHWSGHAGLEPACGDVLDLESLKTACAGCEVVYYLVHSMIAQKGGFVAADRTAARNMAQAAASAGVKRIIYLGGLAEARHGKLSKHLSSRIEVAEILQSGPVPATDLRAPMILGSGSASFEIMRYLVEHLPAMTTPRWVHSLNQPIAIRDVVAYLVGCLERPATVGQTYDIGGPDILTYAQLLQIYAEEAGLRKRVIIPVPVLTPTLSALWINLISPVPTAIALPLTEGLTSEAVCRDSRIRQIIPQDLLSCREAIRIALQRLRQELWEEVPAREHGPIPPEWPHPGDADYAGGTTFRYACSLTAAAAPGQVWAAVSRIGGKGGYYSCDGLWRLRGLVDRLAGGRGLGPRRAHGELPKVGERFDFWRVLKLEPPRRLRLLAEMKAPGDALLELEIRAAGSTSSELRLKSTFIPRGLAGLLYWHAFYPAHVHVFRQLLAGIARAAGAA